MCIHQEWGSNMLQRNSNGTLVFSVKTSPALLRCFLSESALTVERVYHYVFHREAKSSTPSGTFSR